MQIQLKQTEIIAAIKQYVTSQGINLTGKSVDIAFSATRGAAGIIADVSIEDVAIPGFSDSNVTDESAKPVLAVVSNTPVAAVETAAAEAPEVPAAETTKATSLFNN